MGLVFYLFRSLSSTLSFILFYFDWFGFVGLREMEGNDGSERDGFVGDGRQ
jgi:hypothetical protein